MIEAGADRPKVLYVIGAHRSGSTVLGVTLGNCDGVFFAGELHSWLTRRGVPSFGGEQGAELWQAIADEVPNAQELFGHETQLTLDRSSVVYRPHKWPQRRRLRGPYRRIYQDLYRAIARQTGSTQIVDTSHYPLRAIELQALDGIELYLLFLVRDPQGVVDSFDARHSDSPSKSLFLTNAQLWVTHALCLLAFARQPRERRMFVRHEDFLADPAGVLGQILEQSGSRATIPDLTALRTGSPLQGNRFLKRSEVIALRGPGAPPRRSLLTKAMQLPFALVFSRLRPAAPARPGSHSADVPAAERALIAWRAMGLVDRVPAPALRWAGRQQFRPLIGPVVKALSSRLLHGTRVVAHGQAAGLRVDPAGAAAGYGLGTSEPLIQDVFAEHVRRGGVVWDVGANIGFYSLIASRLVGDGEVVAFEPLPANQQAIARNLALNEIANVRLVPIALSDAEGEAELEIHASPTWAKLDTSGDTAFKRDGEVSDRVRVEVSTLDAQLESHAAPDLVKMDIEGAEVAALRGAAKLLDEHRPTLICELHGTNVAVTELLESHGYDVRAVETPQIRPQDAEWYVHVLATPRSSA